MQPDARQDRLFQQILNDSQTGVAVFDAVYDEQATLIDFQFAYINPAAATLFRRPADSLIGSSYLTYFTEAERSGLFQIYKDVLTSRQPCRMPQVPYFADGIRGWFDLNVTPYQQAVIVTFVDITALKQAQLEETRQTAFFDQLLQTSPNGVIAYEAVRTGEPGGQSAIVDFQPVFFNNAYERIFNEAASSVQDLSFRQRFQGTDGAELFTFYTQVVETGQSFQRERYYPHLERWLLLAGEKLFDGFLVVISDITRQKETALAQQQLTQALQQANQELKRSNENLEQFAYVASHDLQEPLRKIQSFSQLVQTQYGEALGIQGADLLQRLTSASTRMSTLIRDLLTYSRISSQPASIAPVALNDVIEQAMDDLSLSIQDSHAQLSIASLPVVPGDKLQLGQLVQNLLSNALKFRRPGVAPHIVIRASQVKAADVPGLPQPTDESFTCLTVADNGIGFDEKYTDRIFQVFQRLHGKQEFAGTGIGLAICQKVASNHGGLLTAQSQPGRGATFRLYLPLP